MAKKGSGFRRCSCRACKAGIHTKREGYMVRKAVRAHRHSVKQMLRSGNYNIPDKFSLSYTD